MDGFNTFEKQDKILLGLNSGSDAAAALRSGCRFILFYFVPKIRSPASPRPGTI